MSQLVSLSPIADGANFILAFSTLVSAAFVYQRSRAASKLVALAGGVALVGVVVEELLMYGNVVSLRSEARFIGIQLVNALRHVVYFGGLALALHTIAKERRA